MSKDTVKGALVGAIVAGILVVAVNATAGTGIGGVFNLGKVNKVNAQSTLTGAAKQPQLALRNAGNGPALSLTVRPGHVPMRVSSKRMVPNLNANYLGGKAASDFVGACARGSLAAVASFYAPQVPADPTYVTPHRYGGEDGFACNGSEPELTKESTGWFRLQIADPLPDNHSYLLFINPDARGSTPLYGDGNSALGGSNGPVWDIHVFDKNGTPADPYYLDVQLVTE
jgi:hypothetical protein